MPAHSAADEGFRPDINALRALAVLAVIAFHFGLPAHAGFVGVDIFFVISGYLIGGQVQSRIDRRTFGLAWFFASRVRRIVPALAVMCAAVVAWGWCVQLPEDFKALVRSMRGTLLFKSNVEFASQLNYFDLGAAYKPLLHTWSLSVEAQFYLVLPFLLMLLARAPQWVRTLLVVIIGAASFSWALHLGTQDAARAFYAFSDRAWEFLPGMVVAWHGGAIAGWLARRERLRSGLAAAAWIALVAACFLLPAGLVWPGWWTLVPVLLATAVIALGEGARAGRLVSIAPVQHVGRISYSLYLWHWPLIVCWRLTKFGDTVSTSETVGLFAATWLLAWLSWRFVEEPVRRKRAWGAPRRLLPGYVGLAAVGALCTTLILQDDGVPRRLPDELRGAVVAAKYQEELHDGTCWDLAGNGGEALPDACRLGAKGASPVFAIWGDSHALQYRFALGQSADDAQLPGALLHRPGCEPFLGQMKDAACAAHNAQVMRFLEQTRSIRTVVISVRQDNAERVQRAWTTAGMLLQRGWRVVVLGPLPEGRNAVAQDWAARELLARGAIRDVTVPIDATTRVASYADRLALWRHEAAAMQARYPQQLIALDLSPLFCDARQCWLVRDGVGLFRDADHLTRAGTQLVVPAILDAIRPAAR